MIMCSWVSLNLGIFQEGLGPSFTPLRDTLNSKAMALAVGSITHSSRKNLSLFQKPAIQPIHTSAPAMENITSTHGAELSNIRGQAL